MIRDLFTKALSFLRKRPTAAPKKSPGLRLEALEDRQMLAADPILFDSNSTGWSAFHDQTSTQYSTTFNQLKAGSIPVDLEITDDGSQARIGSVWVKNPDGRAWAAFRNMSDTSFHTRWT